MRYQRSLSWLQLIFAVLAAVDFIKKSMSTKGMIEEEVQDYNTGTHILHIHIPKSATTGIKRFSKFKGTQNYPYYIYNDKCMNECIHVIFTYI